METRVVRKTWYDEAAKKGRIQFEPQYKARRKWFWQSRHRWVPWRDHSTPIRFGTKAEALEFCLRKKAGTPHNRMVSEVVT